MQITDSDFTRPKDEYLSYFGRPYDVLVVSDDQTTANMDPCFPMLEEFLELLNKCVLLLINTYFESQL